VGVVQVGVMGSSAGGHLAGLAMTLGPDDTNRFEAKPPPHHAPTGVDALPATADL
jgi:acetyl esterase/lipase